MWNRLRLGNLLVKPQNPQCQVDAVLGGDKRDALGKAGSALFDPRM